MDRVSEEIKQKIVNDILLCKKSLSSRKQSQKAKLPEQGQLKYAQVQSLLKMPKSKLILEKLFSESNFEQNYASHLQSLLIGDQSKPTKPHPVSDNSGGATQEKSLQVNFNTYSSDCNKDMEQ